jgi:O-antigen/teichoic acid export membrane protein
MSGMVKNIINHLGFRKYASNTLWMYLEQLHKFCFNLFVGIWLARFLGPKDFGLLNYILAFGGLLGSIAKLGLDSVLVKFLLDDPKSASRSLSTAMWMKFIASIVMTLILLCILNFTEESNSNKAFIFLIALSFIFQSLEVVDFYFQSKVLSKEISISRIIQITISALIKIILISTNSDLLWFVFAYLCDQILLAIFYLIVYIRKEQYFFGFKFDYEIAKKLINESWPQIFTGLVIMIYMRIDQIMIKNILGEESLGVYSVAVRLIELCYLIPVIMVNSLFPAIIAAKKFSEERYQLRLRQLFTLLIWTSIIISIIFSFFASDLINLGFGSKYKEASSVLLICVWTSVFVFYGCLRGKILVLEDLQIYGLVYTSIGAVVNIILNLFLIKIYGIVGSAIATLIAQAVSAVMVPLFFRKDRDSVVFFFNALIFKKIF